MGASRLHIAMLPASLAAHAVGPKVQRRAVDVLAQGERFLGFLKVMVCERAVSRTTETVARLRAPRGFWKACSRICFNRQGSPSATRDLRKALYCYIAALRKGSKTKCGMLGQLRPHQRRSHGGTLNALKCPELGALLYDWFIGCLHSYHARATNTLLLQQARVILGRMIATGYQPHNPPDVRGKHGTNWMVRWRRMYGVRSR